MRIIKKNKVNILIIGLIMMTVLLCFSTQVQAAPKVILDGTTLSFDVNPTIENGRTLVPLRAIFEAMGANVSWDRNTQTATAVKGSTNVVLKIGSLEPTINGQINRLDVPAKIVDGRTIAPLRFIGEAFGGTVGWDQGSQTITILSKLETSRSAAENITANRNAVITGSTVNVRGGPGTTNSVISQVAQGDSLPLLEQSGDWYRIKLQNGSTGWVAGWLVSVNTPSPAVQSSSVQEPQVNSAGIESHAARGISLEVIEKADATTAVIAANSAFEYSQFFLTNPDRLVVNLGGIAIGSIPPVTEVGSESVDQIRAGYFQRDPDITRVVFELLDSAQYDISISSDHKTLTVLTYVPDIDNSYSGETVAIDAGHGSPDPGCIGQMGTKEKDVTLDIARRVEEILQSSGTNVIMTRPGENEAESLLKITDIANRAKADIFVSIHINAAGDTTLGGTMTFVHSGSSAGTRIQESNRLAKNIQSELVKGIGLKDMGVRYANFAVLRTSIMPAVLCELAFMSNPAEEKKINTDVFRKNAAEAITKGIGLYFSERRNA